MPGHYVKDGGVWKEITTTAPKINVGGTWTDVKEIHAKDAGVWVKVWPTALPPIPTNLRFQFTLWQNSRYEVRPLWDPVQSELADGYHIEITRVGSPNPANAVVADMVRQNYYDDIYVGTTGGIVLTYRVRSYKGAQVGDWSAPITVTTPQNAGFGLTSFIGQIQDYYGHIYIQIQHDGNSENKGFIMYRQQLPYYDWTEVARGPLSGTLTNVDDSYDSAHYRGGSAGTVNTQHQWSIDITWSWHLTNSWGKPNDQAGSPHPANWGPGANYAVWKPAAPHDRYIRLNAVSQNVYRQQPTNSIGWVGGVMRCGGAAGDMLGIYFYNKPNLTEWGFRNRIKSGMAIHWGLGRRNDGGQLNVTFGFVGADFSHGFGGDPRALYGIFGTRTWQRNQGEDFVLPSDWCAAFCDPAQPHGALGVVSGNTAAQYAEFGNIAEIMGGWVNGQLTIYSPMG